MKLKENPKIKSAPHGGTKLIQNSLKRRINIRRSVHLFAIARRSKKTLILLKSHVTWPFNHVRVGKTFDWTASIPSGWIITGSVKSLSDGVNYSGADCATIFGSDTTSHSIKSHDSAPIAFKSCDFSKKSCKVTQTLHKIFDPPIRSFSDWSCDLTL